MAPRFRFSRAFLDAKDRIDGRASRDVKLYRAERLTQAGSVDPEIVTMSDRYIYWLLNLREQYPTFASYKRAMQ